jgi:hypothetical protein
LQNFMAADLAQTTLATLAFAPFLLPTGYLLGLASNAFGMRVRSVAEAVLFSPAFSIAATPILVVLLKTVSSLELAVRGVSPAGCHLHCHAGASESFLGSTGFGERTYRLREGFGWPGPTHINSFRRSR